MKMKECLLRIKKPIGTKMKVINGNNIDVLKQYPDNYFDAIVTDAPYGLGKEPNAEELMKDWIEKGYHEISGTGFMGKEWDAFVPQPLFWKEAFRVLKHGGHVLSFFGTRTYDWGVMAMRFAGFEVRDCIQWLYGCLSDDTEILTENGWMEYKHFRKIKKGSILVYNIYNDEYFFEQPEKWNEYTIKDTCYRIESDNTDQIVSRNHRCLVERDGVILFEFAETLSQERQANIPFLESLSKSQTRKSYSTTLATITPIEYSGVVFCPTVSTGAFVARRNGKIFLTGNSGFPKSHNISKAIDKKPNLQYIKEWKKWLENEINKSEKSQKQINDECNFNAIGYARYDSNDNWATNRPTKEKWDIMKSVIGINTDEWDFICDSNADERGYIESSGGLAGGSGNTVGRFTGKELSNNSISEDAKKWDGWGSALKPASEQIVLARKPLEKGLSIAENVLKWGTGGINIDGCRIGNETLINSYCKKKEGYVSDENGASGGMFSKDGENIVNGRFPANLILSHHPECTLNGLKKVKSNAHHTTKYNENETLYKGGWKDGEDFGNKFADENGEETIEDWTCHEDCPIKIMDEQSGISKSGKNIEEKGTGGIWQKSSGLPVGNQYGDTGGASRFFYCPKASKSERNNGLDGFEEKRPDTRDSKGMGVFEEKGVGKQSNFHPTVKPVKLMQYLVRLITPPNGKVLDPFCGSGTTGIACKLEGFDFVGIEQDAEYCKIAEARIANYQEEPEKPLKFIEEEDKPRVIQQTLF